MPENLAALRDSGEFETYKGVGVAAPAKSESAYERAFLKTHDDIMADLGKLAYMAGTTAVTAFMMGEMLHVGNVGDSRAVLGQKQGDSEPWSALDLTKDQTCFRRDERERIHKEAKMPVEFLTLGMFYGEEEITEDFEEESLALAADPPRVFIVGRKFPASAFSRSLGDALAKMAGVSPEPELSTHQLTRDDKCMIIASDGVWEFVGNAEAVQIVQKYKDKPQEAASELVRMSFDRWLEAGEERTDDITAIVVVFDTAGCKPVVKSKWDIARRKFLTNRDAAARFRNAVLETLKRKKGTKDLHTKNLFPDYNWDYGAIEKEMGAKITTSPLTK
jgi:serine/threonine protein phosphatase PrpC